MELTKDILEIIYFLSTPLLALFAYKALGQIKQTKNQIDESRKSRQLSSKRESYKLSAEKCDYFLNNLIPKMNLIYRKLEEENVKFFEDSEVIIANKRITVNPDLKKPEDLLKLIDDVPILELFNALESFAVFFVSGVADENIAFLTIGRSYCSTVKTYLPILIPLSDNNKHFANTLNLFIIWHSRIEKENLEKEKTKIEEKLKQSQTVNIDPIGTKD
ncbi:hypothetical protein SAMN05444483_12330 [Salegentibacter echinorum]|uniref:Uncharacterized protein n=1 Tax=Salegentibacter echinorum TaxID=1073325 RepID=A0A1M5M104_SALEC|nr:hypothetical protein [Salegentibacter echinorum]SHG70579.1 hypothetical protein SAMN05444483_12330 [Salegentibacter echinorum]